MIIKKNNLIVIGDELIKEIKERKNPFDTYTIIVPNLLVEQWFKTYWMQKTNSVLMNVVFKRLRPFISEKFNKDEKELISKEVLSSLLMNELLDNLKEYKKLNTYFYKNESIDSINLYDLCSSLSTLILSYEETCFSPTGEIQKLIDNIKKNNKSYTFLSDVISTDIENKDRVFVFGFYKIEPLFIKALDKLGAKIYIQKEGDNKEIEHVYSCASKEREIEHLHSQICHILKDGNEKVCDITVYVPSLSEYETIIKKVFISSDEKEYPLVPYVIVNTEKFDSSLALALRTLYNILYFKQMTRLDFVNLLTNNIIQKERNISDENAEIIIDALDKMNIYRDNPKEDQWDYAIKRILLTKLIGGAYGIENKVEFNEKKYLPYGSIDLDDESIIALVKLLEDIDSFRKSFEEVSIYYKKDLINLKSELDKLFAFSSQGNNYYYSSILKVIDDMIAKDKGIPFEILFMNLIDHSQGVTIYPSNMLTGGITFINFDKKNIIASKHMFFIGMSNNNLPRKNIFSELDERSDKEDKSLEDKNIYHMLINNAEQIYVSYVNMDLVTLEEFTYSNLLQFDEKNIIKIGLQETRKYEDLFTKREIEKKDYRANLIGTNKKEQFEKNEMPPYEYPLSVKYKDLASFIKENLMSKMDRLFKEYDSSLDKRNEMYEPIFCDAITISNMKKEFLSLYIENGGADLSLNQINSVKEKYSLLSSCPYVIEDTVHDLLKKSKQYYDKFSSNFIVEPPFEQNILLQLEGKEDFVWKVIVDSPFIIQKENDQLHFYYYKVKATVKEKENNDLAELYIISLTYIARLDDNNEYCIFLNNHKFSLNKEKAIAILNNLYVGMNDFSNELIVGLKTLESNSLDEMVKNIDYQSWQYFDDRHLINYGEILQKQKKEYESLKEKYLDFVQKNLLYITPKEEEKKC